MVIVCVLRRVVVSPGKMSNKKNKEIAAHDSESEEEQDSASEKDSDFDSDGNFVGDKVGFYL